MVWPSPRPVTLTITSGESYVLLPVRSPEAVESVIPIPVIRGAVEERNKADPRILATRVVQTGPDAEGRVSVRKVLPQPERTVEGVGTVVSGGSVWTRSIREGDPNSSVWTVECVRELKRGDWNTKITSTVELSSTAEEFRMKESIGAREGSTTVFERAWDTRIKRGLM